MWLKEDAEGNVDITDLEQKLQVSWNAPKTAVEETIMFYSSTARVVDS